MIVCRFDDPIAFLRRAGVFLEQREAENNLVLGIARGLAASGSAPADTLLATGLDFCVLYADRANTTSNAIYQRIGYRPLCDVAQVDFEDPVSSQQEG